MTIGLVRQVTIDQEMREAYLDYAMSVIVSRALPDARDGLKPVHRRILYAMYDMGLRADTAYKKCARIVGEVLGKYHPHGDAAVYEALVRMAQDFTMRAPLVDGQGNFGSIDGDGAAAMRYTESRLTAISEELLTDIGMETVDFADNFDGTLQEPTVLPASFPNLLVNGASGIAVGMSTNIPPHNLSEISDALIYMLDRWETLDEVTVQDLMAFVKGPDFPTGGLVYRHESDEDDSLVTAYATGRGKVTMRAKLHIEDIGRGKVRIIISEIPYQTNKSGLIERIASLVRDGRLEGIADLRDESDRQGLRLAIELARGAEPEPVIERLFRLTPLQETFSIIMLALVEGEPRLLSLKQSLKVYLDHRLVVIERRSRHELARARDRAHILLGLLTALDKLDEVIDTIRRSRTVESARNNLTRLLSISERQASAILDMQLRRLAALERKKLQDEYDQVSARIQYLETLLDSPKLMRNVISEEVRTIKDAYAEPRRTIILNSTAMRTVTLDSLRLPEEATWVTLTTDGIIGRTLDDQMPSVRLDQEQPPRFLVPASAAATTYLFATDGRCATIPVHQLPQVITPEEGVAYSDLCGFRQGEAIAAVLSPGDVGDPEDAYLVFVTTGGEVKRLRLSDLPGLMGNVFKVIDLEAGDALGWVLLARNESTLLLTTGRGQTIRFSCADVRPTGLGAGGMRGIRMSEPGDRVVGADIGVDGQYLWVITADGVAKSSPLDQYPVQGRAGVGVVTMKVPPRSEALIGAVVGGWDDTLIVLTDAPRAYPLPLASAPTGRRDKRGDIVVSLREGERITAVYRQPTVEKVTEA